MSAYRNERISYVLQRRTDGGDWIDIDQFADREVALAYRRTMETTGRIVKRTLTDEEIS